MAQVTIYLDKETQRLLKRSAAAAGTSVSRWVARSIRAHAGDTWPADVRRLAGAWKDFPDRESAANAGKDLPRETL